MIFNQFLYKNCIFLLPLLLVYLNVVYCALISCPNRCQCINDSLEGDRIIITCKWSRIRREANLFSDFPFSIVKTLNIECESDNENEMLESELFDDAFSNFRILQNLKIKNCAFRRLTTNVFLGLVNLRSLYLYGLGFNNSSLQFADGIFDNLLKLEKLLIVNSHIQSLPSRPFCNSPNLQILNMSTNWLSSLDTALDCRSLEQLIIVDFALNAIKSITADDFKSLANIRQLILSSNSINYIHRNAFKANQFLQHLHLDHNSIQELPTLPDTLIHLDVSMNQLNIIPSSITNLLNIISLNLSANSIDNNAPFRISSKNLEIIDLGYNNLIDIPTAILNNSIENLIHLRLANNHIANLENLFLSNFSRLETLDLNSNSILAIDGKHLSYMVNLKYLKLSNNSIFSMYNTDEAADNRWTISNIIDLNLSDNLLTEIPTIISTFVKVVNLNLSRNQISQIRKFVFSKLPSLQVLDLSHNQIASIEQHTLTNVPRLTTLNLSNNFISYLSPSAFSKNPKLGTINLSHNFIHTIINEIFVNVPRLTELILNHNLIEILQWNQLPSTLVSIDLSNNLITMIDSTTSNTILKNIELYNNRIMLISSEQIPATVESLNISHNLIDNLSKETLKNKLSLKSLDISFNQLHQLNYESFVRQNDNENANGQQLSLYIRGNPLICSCEMNLLLNHNNFEATSLFSFSASSVVDGDHLKITDRHLVTCKHRIDERNIPLLTIKDNDLLCNYKQICEPGCICCQYGNCDCKSKCPPGCQCYHNANYSINIVRCISLDKNDRGSFSPKDLPMYATNIFLENMSLPIIRSHDFLGRTRLLELFINSSSVEEIQPLSFNTLPSLQLLDLSGNKLTNFEGNEMYRTAKVSHLFLNDNFLMTLKGNLRREVPALKFITLHNNKFKEIPELLSSEADLSNISAISLGHNPYRCDCVDPYGKLTWFINNVNLVVDFNNVFCVENVTEAFLHNDTTILSAYPPNIGNDIYTISMSDFLLNINKTFCGPNPNGIFGNKDRHDSILLAILILTTIMIIIGVIIFTINIVKRMQLLLKANQERRYKLPVKTVPTTPIVLSSSSPMPLINYDAFISYSKKDEKLITDIICRQLESEDYLLCLLHRDCPSYNSQLHSICDELIQQIDCSQSLILILTKNFLENEWKTLQIKTSHRLFAKNRAKKLIAVLGDGIQSNELENELGQILRKNTCIRMSDPLFWNLLHSSLPIRINMYNDCAVHSTHSSQIYADCYGNIVPSNII